MEEDTLPPPDAPPPPAAPEIVPGGDAHSPAELGYRGWLAVLKRIWVMNDFHGLALLAAGMAFYAFLAFVPAIAALVLLYGLAADPASVSGLMDTVIALVPADVAGLIRDQLLAIVTANARITGIGLIVALFFAIFGAMRASGAAMQALNVIYEEHESRSLLGFYAMSALLTVGAILLGLVALAAASAFAWLELRSEAELRPGIRLGAQIATWGLAALLASFAFASVYRYAPDRRQAKWRWITLGSVLATFLWVLATFGFGLYATYVANYNATYGSLGAIVVFLMWLWLTSYAVLIGGLVNAESERQTFVDSTVGPDRPIGQRGAVMADNQSLDAASIYLLEKKRRRQADREARRATRTVFGLPRILRRNREPDAG